MPNTVDVVNNQQSVAPEVETDEQFDARISAIESGTTFVIDSQEENTPEPEEDDKKSNNGSDDKSNENDDKSNGDNDKSNGNNEPTKESPNVDPQDNNSGEDSDNVKTEDDIIDQEDKGGDDASNVKDEIKDGNVLEKFNISSEKELEEILFELKQSRIFKDENEKLLGTAKILERAEVTEEDIGLLLAIKAGDKGTIIDLAKKANIDLDEELEPQKVDLDRFKETDFDKKLDDFMYRAKAMSVEPTKVIGVVEKWDDESLQKILSEPDSQKAIVSHIQDGTYEKVMAKVNELKSTDYLGKFSQNNAYVQYTLALRELNRIYSGDPVETTTVNREKNSVKGNNNTTTNKSSVAEKQVEAREEFDASEASDTAFANQDSQQQQQPTVIDTSKMTEEEWEKYIDDVESGAIR